MTPEFEIPSVAADDEVSQLIRTLFAADSRLTELTSGEIDTVADHTGRSLFLRQAENRWHEVDAAKQAAIIDSLPANVAVLDADGIIVSVNEGWRIFAQANGLHDSSFCVGMDYLAVCENSPDESARRIAAGIRSVLRREALSFTSEYPCHSPDGEAWYVVTVTALDLEQSTGIVAMHFNVTDRKQKEAELRRFGLAMHAMEDAVFLVDRESMRFTYVNEAACRLQSRTKAELILEDPWLVVGTTKTALTTIYDEVIANGADPKSLEISRQLAEGAPSCFEVRLQAQIAGGQTTVVMLVRDITEGKRAERVIVHLNRVHAMLSGISTLIVRVRERDAMLRGACRIAVEEGGLPMAWIGLVDRACLKVVPVASAGVDDDFFTTVADRLSLDAPPSAEASLTARAIASKCNMISNDLQNDPKIRYAHIHARRGVHSIAILPLIVAEEAVGVLALYAPGTGFFHGEEMKLLATLAGNISFAIDHISKQERLDHLAYYDVLTGLANRKLFLERVAQYVRSAAAADQKLALIVIDLERFKNINDTFGASAGDALLRQVASWLKRAVGDANQLTRLGADLFAVVLPNIGHEEQMARLLEETIDTFLKHTFHLNDEGFRVSGKLGIAMFPDDGSDAGTLFRNAEAALKKAKSSGDRYLFYAQKMTATVAGRLSLEYRMRLALENSEFELHYQAKLRLSDGQLSGVEALLRWNDPRTGLVSPSRFIPVLEETGLICDVGRWVLDQAVADHLSWRRRGWRTPRVAVNVSARQLGSRAFVAQIKQATELDPYAAEGLELEITESLIMRDIANGCAMLRTIRDMGVTIAIDDFGTGFSSLSYLTKLPVDSLKIDRSFVNDMSTGPKGALLVSTIINLAHSLSLKVVAEGVETLEQARILGELRCDEVQGYLYSAPLSRSEFERSYLIGSPTTLALSR